LQAPEVRAFQHQRASLFHELKQLKAALTLAEQQGLAGLAEEVSKNLEMLEGQIEIVDRLAPTVPNGSASSEDTWPSIRQRLKGVGGDLDYSTLYSVLCRSAHGDAEPLIERCIARIVAHGSGRRDEITRALLVHFRETTCAFSRMMIAQASFRLIKAAGSFAGHYGFRPLLETVVASLEAIRVLGDEAAAETRALRESDAWKSA
jgi:hypothetical protein